MLESEAAGGDVPMEQGTSGQEDGPVGQPAVVSIAESGRAPSFSPFSVAPPVGESSSDSSDTESDQSRDKQVRRSCHLHFCIFHTFARSPSGLIAT